MEAVKLEELNEETKPELIHSQELKEKDIIITALLTCYLPIFGWAYSKGLKGLLIGLVYAPMAFLLFVPIFGWAAFAGAHVYMSYLNLQNQEDHFLMSYHQR